jgi:hypothetical protein
MAKCKTCGKTIRVPQEWSTGAAVRKHYWRNHPERMEKFRADKVAETSIPPKKRRG